MSPYWFIAFIVWSVTMTGAGYEFKSYQDKAAAEADTIAGQTYLIGVKDQQATITNGVNNGYQTGIKAIDDLYATAPQSVGVQSPGNRKAGMPSTARGVQAQQHSLKFHLTFKQCDIEEAKLDGLWIRDVKLSQIK
jgi:hypothetical protein